jgi:hypothetical protein
VSLVLPVLYHWSRTENRARINRHGLRPTCPTGTVFSPTGHVLDPDDEAASFNAVCLGTSPSHAWSLSGDITGGHGDSFDLWQVVLEDDDEVHPMPFHGYRLEEIRVANRIPKSQIWYVGTRVVDDRRRRRWREEPTADGGLRRVPVGDA